MTIKVFSRKKNNIDNRGYFVEFLNEDENFLDFRGQIYFTNIKRNCSRGNHYHKKRSELFCLVKGKIRVITKNIKTNKISSKIIDSSNFQFKTFIIQPFVAHTFLNKYCSEAILISYSNKQYKKNEKDVYNYKLDESS